MLFSHILPYTYQAQQQKSRAKDQMNFQREMSNTAYQRAMADMSKAGINPIMVSKIGGASTPTGAMAKTPNLGNAGSRTIQNMSTAKQMQLTDATIKKTEASTALELSKKEEIDQKTGSGYWNSIVSNLSQQNRKISTEILNIMATTSQTQLRNTIQRWEYMYFKNRGYPSQVLITTMENGMKTDLYHSLSEKEKQKYFGTVRNALDSIMTNADEFQKDPAGYLKANFPPLVVSGLMLILPGMFKKWTNTKKTIDANKRKADRHGKNRKQ